MRKRPSSTALEPPEFVAILPSAAKPCSPHRFCRLVAVLVPSCLHLPFRPKVLPHGSRQLLGSPELLPRESAYQQILPVALNLNWGSFAIHHVGVDFCPPTAFQGFPIEIHMAVGQKPVFPVNLPIPTKLGSNMSGEFTYPKMVPLVLTHSHVAFGCPGNEAT